MALQDQYPNLPGILSEFKDGGLQLRVDPNPPATDSVLILGTAVDGPIMEPVAVDPATVELVFGSATLPNGLPNGSTLVKAFEEAYAAGCRDIRLMRVTGKKATATVKGAAVTTTKEDALEEVVGAVAGNKEVTLDLNLEEIDVNSVIVNIEGQIVAPTNITVTNGIAGSAFATVKIAENVANAGAAIFVSYTSADGSESRTDNAHTATDASNPVYFIAEGEDQVFTISKQPVSGTLKLYADGVEVRSDAFTVDTVAKTVTLKPGFLFRGQFLEVTYLSVETKTVQPELHIDAVYGGTVYNQVKVKVEDIVAGGVTVGKAVVITKPESKKPQTNEEPLVFRSLDFPNFALMANAINAHVRNNVVRAWVSESFKTAATSELVVEPIKNLSGGEDGTAISKYELYQALGGKQDAQGNIIAPGAYQLLENYNVDFIVPAGVYADDELPGKYDNFAYQLALACAVISHRNDTVLGVIATKSPDEAGLSGVKEHVDRLLARRNDYLMRDKVGNILKDSTGRPIDLGRFLSVIAGPDLVFSTARLGSYTENSAAAYAGSLTVMPAHQAPTNKPIDYAFGMRYNFSNAQLDALTGARYVTYKYKNNGAQIAVTDAMTAAQPDSDYRRLNTVRVVKAVVDRIREIADPFIGQPNEASQRNALSAAISKALDQLKAAGVISGSEFNIVATPQDILLGQLKIELTLMPPQELRRITTIVSLRPAS